MPVQGASIVKTLKQDMLNKVPEITVFFWIIKVLCTTVGETASDFMNTRLNLGLTGTSYVMGAALAAVLYFQLRSRKYIPGLYWLAVVLISIFGTLITDNLTDKYGVPLETTTIIFSAALALTFAIWFTKERTLSIHTIFTRRREVFYWLAILFTFALGTAAGDLMAEGLGLGYLVAGIMSLVMIAGMTVAWRLKLNPVLAFWTAYVLTRPLGASLGDYLSQAPTNGGLGLGTVTTSLAFLAAIAVTVIYLAITKMDVAAGTSTDGSTVTRRYAPVAHSGSPMMGRKSVAVAMFALVVAAGPSCYWYCRVLSPASSVETSPGSPLGDLSSFRQIAEDTLVLVHKGDWSSAKSRITDLESAWDQAERHLKPLNSAVWGSLDDSIDAALRQMRSWHPQAGACSASLETLITNFRAVDEGTVGGTVGVSP